MHDFVLAARRDHAGLERFRTFFETHEHDHFRAERLLVELDRLLAAAIEEQIGFVVNTILLWPLGRFARSVTLTDWNFLKRRDPNIAGALAYSNASLQSNH